MKSMGTETVRVNEILKLITERRLFRGCLLRSPLKSLMSVRKVEGRQVDVYLYDVRYGYITYVLVFVLTGCKS